MENDHNLFGFEGTIAPEGIVKDIQEEWEQDGVCLYLKNGVFKVTYPKKEDKDNALNLAKSFIQWWKFQNNTKIEVIFHHFWEPKENRKNHFLNFEESVGTTDRLASVHSKTLTMTYNIMAKARIIGKSDSYSFIANKDMVEKSLNNPSLKKALEYYSDEVVDEKHPLYGIYKAIEELTSVIGGREKLGLLAGKSKRYVDDLMQTANSERHARSISVRLLSDGECKERAKMLINAYAQSLK